MLLPHLVVLLGDRKRSEILMPLSLREVHDPDYPTVVALLTLSYTVVTVRESFTGCGGTGIDL